MANFQAKPLASRNRKSRKDCRCVRNCPTTTARARTALGVPFCLSARQISLALVAIAALNVYAFALPWALSSNFFKGDCCCGDRRL